MKKLNQRMKLFLIIIMVFTLLIQQSSGNRKIIDMSFDLNEQSHDNMIGKVMMCIGDTLSQCFNMQIAFDISIVWVVDYDNDSKQKNKFAKNKSDTFEMINNSQCFDYKEYHLLKGFKGIDQIAFGINEHKEMDLIFTIVTSSILPIINSIDGIIGLGLFNDDNSFINQLLYQHIIYNRFFAIEGIFGDKALLHFGILPSKIYEDFVHYGTCNVIEMMNEDRQNNNWECQVTEISYDNERFKESQRQIVQFNYSKKYISPPYKLKTHIWDLFADQQYSGICSFNTLKNDNAFIKCTKEVTKYFTINLSLNDWKMKIYIDDLVKNSDQEKPVIFYFKTNNDQWIFGYDYLKYYTIVFDYDNYKIGFYHNKWINNQHLLLSHLNNNDMNVEDSKSVSKDHQAVKPFTLIMIIIIIICMIIIIIIILYRFKSYYKINKRKKINFLIPINSIINQKLYPIRQNKPSYSNNN